MQGLYMSDLAHKKMPSVPYFNVVVKVRDVYARARCVFHMFDDFLGGGWLGAAGSRNG